MTHSRASFLDSLRGVERSLGEDALSTRALIPANAQHNETARLLRRGLYVVGFNLLEDFLKARTGELLALASATHLAFADLPPGLRKAAVSSAYSSGFSQARFHREDADTILQDVAAAVASTAGGSTLHLHRYSFLHAGSNVGAQDVSDVLSALHIRGPWKQLDALAALCGIGGLPLEDLYSTLLQSRHAAAHTSTANVEVGDLRNLLRTAATLAMVFDLACSSRFLRVRENEPHAPEAAKSDVVPEVELRVVTEHPRGWAELRSDGRAARVHATQSLAIAGALSRVRRPQSLIVKRSDGSPVDWYPYGY